MHHPHSDLGSVSFYVFPFNECVWWTCESIDLHFITTDSFRYIHKGQDENIGQTAESAFADLSIYKRSHQHIAA